MAHVTVTAKDTKLDLTCNAVVSFSAEYSINITVFSGYSYIFGNEKLFIWDKRELLG